MVLEDETLGFSELNIEADTVAEEDYPGSVNDNVKPSDQPVMSVPPSEPHEGLNNLEGDPLEMSAPSIWNSAPEAEQVTEGLSTPLTKREKRRMKEARKLAEVQQLEHSKGKPTKTARDSLSATAIKQEKNVYTKQSVTKLESKANADPQTGWSRATIDEIVQSIDKRSEKLASRWASALPGEYPLMDLSPFTDPRPAAYLAPATALPKRSDNLSRNR